MEFRLQAESFAPGAFRLKAGLHARCDKPRDGVLLIISDALVAQRSLTNQQKESSRLLKLTFLKALTKPIQSVIALASPTTASAGAASALWTFPSVLGSAMLIAWAAEAAQFLVSQGLALAILAWLQTLPEFAVEAVIAWHAGQTAADPTVAPAIKADATALMSANLIG